MHDIAWHWSRFRRPNNASILSLNLIVRRMCGKITSPCRRFVAIVPFLIHNLQDRLYQINSGPEIVKDSGGRGRKISVVDAYFIGKFREFLESDRQYTCEELAQELDLCHGTVHSIIRNRLATEFAVSVKQGQDKLPTLYWLIKLHKRPYKARFIAI